MFLVSTLTIGHCSTIKNIVKKCTGESVTTGSENRDLVGAEVVASAVLIRGTGRGAAV